MALQGRINVDVLFHDTDGTASLKVVSLEGSTEYATGKVAVVTGTVGTTRVTISPASLTYKDAAGDVVSFASVRRIAFQASGPPVALIRGGLASNISAWSVNDVCVVSESLSGSLVAGGYGVATTAGTASYTMVIYGT
jgi:hypothetical protein